MRIGIDARFFGPQETGIGRYVERLVHHLEKIDQQNEYVVFLQSKAWSLWESPNSRWSKQLADYRWYSVAEQLHMPGVLRRAKLDLVHFPHFNVPLFYRGDFVVTIHDLILDQHPTERASTLEPFIFKIKYAMYKVVVRHAVRASRHIITVSEHSRQQLLSRFRIKPEKISVTYESVDPLPEPSHEDVIASHGLHTPYLLYVGNAYPHKNLENMLRAVKLATDLGEQFQLVLVGKRDHFSKRLEQFAHQQGVTNVTFFGFATDAELTTLYQKAHAYFFPSVSEGFGLPGLEAMQAGLPLYASRASCLPEVFGDAAAYFNPYEVADIAVSIQRALHDTIERQRLIEAGRERLTHFSWSTMARETLHIYEATHGPSTIQTASS